MKPNKPALATASSIPPRTYANVAATPTPESPPLPELPHKLDQLHNEVSNLEHMVDTLASQLQPIVRPMPSDGCNGLSGAASSLPHPQSALSGEVEGITDRLTYLRIRLRDLSETLAI